MDDKPLNIAIVGSGAAGLTAAYILQREHMVTLFEKNPILGGHNQTIVIPNGPDKGTPVDAGFMQLNDRTYPTFHRLLQQLRVPVRNSDASFGYWDEKSGFQYAFTNLNGLFAQRNNLWSPSFWLMLRERGWFRARAKRDLAGGRLEALTLGEYLAEGNYSRRFTDSYLIPLGSAHWSTSVREMMDFPVESLARFWGDLGSPDFTGRPQWQTMVDGSQSFVKAVSKTLKTRARTGEAVEEVIRNGEGVLLRTREGKEQSFDKVVMACHADEALALLAEPSEEERRLLSAWSYQKNFTVLHTDRDVMPPLPRAWACRNYTREMETTLAQPLSMTFHMNRIQGLETREQYFVTLNRVRPIPERHVIKEIYFTHPTFTRAAVESQKDLPKLNGENHTYFCGSYFGYGFHEDAVKSALAVAWHFGMDF